MGKEKVKVTGRLVLMRLEPKRLNVVLRNLKWEDEKGESFRGYWLVTLKTGEKVWATWRGALKLMGVREALKGVPIEETPPPLPIPKKIPKELEGGVVLRDYQVEAVKACVTKQHGCVVAPTASGKTIIIAGVIKALNVPTLIIAHRKALARQLQKEMKRLLGEDVGFVGDGEYTIKKITVGVLNSVANRLTTNKRDFSEFQLLIFDEAHTSQQASMGRKIDMAFATKAVLSFTATPFRRKVKGTPWSANDFKKVEDFVFFLQASDVIYEIKLDTLVNNGYIAEPHVAFIPIPSKGEHPLASVRDWRVINSRLVIRDKVRNGYCARIAEKFADKKVLILTDTKTQAEEIAKLINAPIPVFLVFGNGEIYSVEHGKKHRLRKSYTEFLEEVERLPEYVVIATPVFEAGINLPSVKVLVLASDAVSLTRVFQRIGRALRKAEGKTKALIFDFFDSRHPILKNHAYQRLRQYREHKFNVYFTDNEIHKKKLKALTQSL